MPAFILAAQAPEFDLGRVVFVIMLLLGGFIQWVANWWKKKRMEAEAMQRAPESPEESEAREKAWRVQTGTEDPVAQAAVAGNPLDDFLRKFQEIAAPEIVPLQVRVEPPAIPKPKPAPVPIVQVPKPAPLTVAEIPPPLLPFEKVKLHPLARKLAEVDGLRQAVVLREVLGPPKALEAANDRPYQ